MRWIKQFSNDRGVVASYFVSPLALAYDCDEIGKLTTADRNLYVVTTFQYT